MSDPISDIGVQLERDNALRDAQSIIRERGHAVTVRLYEEPTITRDKFNSVINKNTAQTPGFNIYSFPVTYNPTDKQLEESGIRERTHVLIKTAVQDWIDNGFTVDTLKDINSIRATVIIKGAKYEIRDKQLDSQYADTFLYIHLGLNRV